MLGSSIGIRGIVVFGLITIVILNGLNIQIKASNKVVFSPFYVHAIWTCVFSLSLMVFFGKVFLKSIKREYENIYCQKKHSDKKAENEEYFPKSDMTKTVPFLRTKLIFFCISILMVLFSVITIYETVRLTMKSWYETVEIKDDEGISNQYIIALNLNDYYVLKRLVNDDEKLIIDTNEYIFKEKDNVIVTHKYYPNLYVGETINMDDIIGAIEEVQANLNLEGYSEQEINNLFNQIVEKLEEYKELIY